MGKITLLTNHANGMYIVQVIYEKEITIITPKTKCKMYINLQFSFQQIIYQRKLFIKKMVD